MPNKQKYTLTPKQSYEWAQQYETAKIYLRKINSRRPKVAQYLHIYCEWAKLNPDQLIALKENSQDRLAAEKLLERFTAANLDIPDSLRCQTATSIRALYRTNWHRLEAEAGKIEYGTQATHRIISKQERFKLYKNAYNPRDKVIVLLPNCSAMALETLSMLRFEHFEPNWQQQVTPHISLPAELLKGHGKGRYKNVRQETFITPECKRAIIEYQEWFTKTFNYTWKQTDNVLLQIKDGIAQPLKYNGILFAVNQIAKRAGVKWQTHDGRVIVQTALESIGCSNNWIRKIKGRKVRGEETPYSQPAIEQLRKKYQEALPDLEFLGIGFKSEAEEFTPEEREAIKKILEGLKNKTIQFIEPTRG